MDHLPPLNSLRAFEAAGRRLNFRHAAEELGVTQGAVAQQVRALEENLGQKLFQRQPRGLAFTEAGRSFHPRVTAAFADLRQAVQQLTPTPSRVVISVTPSFASKYLLPNLPEFSQAHPEIEVQILATEKISSFFSDGIDLSVRQGQPPFGGALESAHLFAQEIIAVAAPHLIGDLPLSPADLARLPKLHDAHDHWPDFLRLLQVEDTSGRGLMLNQTALCIEAALSGQGVALASRFLVERELQQRQLRQVCSQTLMGKGDFYLLARKGEARSPAADTLFRWLKDRAMQAQGTES